MIFPREVLWWLKVSLLSVSLICGASFVTAMLWRREMKNMVLSLAVCVSMESLKLLLGCFLSVKGVVWLLLE